MHKRQVLGPRSGLVFEVDDMTEAGMIIVKGHGATGAFKRKTPPQVGFEWIDGRGNRQVLALMIEDFLGIQPSDG